ncbi:MULTISPECIES: ABC transporter permease [unclassified Enterococcus]|uniref:ABC transporter permease n=1 Tax=unclassified Enterococcus TaxID=2608891 RepID=UPI001553F603|nr:MULTISPECIES: ABC transporter permease [unclassified Enterococcus]MBS7578081.1 ABC transporter permease [Enterococcus sp. MMGLQ5-2]MBS7585341.1 ABC transporter permease [Enterococcus sp. MMGLQ5-1]NPD13198.1 ABC transporter permease [Enterococcus sp. MMGLQ5-1]NPD37912.1 ABC transporter permease [Enterococcus sp. MMGLQ5-2]
MNLVELIKTATSNLMRSKARTILTILSVFIGAFAISLTMGLNVGVNDFVDKQMASVGTKDEINIMKVNKAAEKEDADEPDEYSAENEQNASAGYMNGTEINYLDEADVAKLKENSQLKDVEPSLATNIQYIEGKSAKKYQASLTYLSGKPNLSLISGKLLDNKSDDYQIMVNESYVKYLGYSNKNIIGQKLTIAVNDYTNQNTEYIEATVVAVPNKSLLNTGGASIINKSLNDKIYEINQKNAPAEMKAKYMYVGAKIKDYQGQDDVDQLKKEMEKDGYQVQGFEEALGQVTGVVNGITGALILFGAIALVAASFGIINTLYMSVQERKQEIGLMKALGLTRGKVFALFSFEAIMIGFFGSLLGLLGAFGIGSVINNIAGQTFLKDLPAFDLIKFNLSSCLIVMGVIMLIAFLAGTLPSRKASRLDPIEALRSE